jgi:hypothetical protein
MVRKINKSMVNPPVPPIPELKPMVLIKEPAPAEQACSGCKCKKSLHYGPKTDWCNTTGCVCQEFKH